MPEFKRRVYAVARTVPPGETITYGEIAERIGERGAAQAVGQRARAQPVPDRRALPPRARGRRLAARLLRPGGVATKRRMLAIEGAGAPTLFA